MAREREIVSRGGRACRDSLCKNTMRVVFVDWRNDFFKEQNGCVR